MDRWREFPGVLHQVRTQISRPLSYVILQNCAIRFESLSKKGLLLRPWRWLDTENITKENTIQLGKYRQTNLPNQISSYLATLRW